MNVNDETLGLFPKFKCGLVHMLPKEHLYETPAGDLIFFYPELNKIKLNKIVGRDTTVNMPIVDTIDDKLEWIVNDNEELETALEIITENVA
jgi:hypothetical protein